MGSIRKTIQNLFNPLPLSFLQRLAPRPVIHLFYHLVSPQPQPHVRHLYPFRPVDAFEQDLIFIKEHFEPISYSQILQKQDSRSNKHKIAVTISFDDGFAECFTYAQPLLLRYNIPCIFFLATNFIDNQSMYYRNKVSLCIEQVENRADQDLNDTLANLNVNFKLDLRSCQEFRTWVKTITAEPVVDQVCSIIGVDVLAYLETKLPYLTTEQVKTLSAEGFTIGAHSRQHHKLGRLPQEKMAEEILESCRWVVERTGQEQVPFSFPNSGDGVERNFLENLRQQNPQVGLIFDTKGLKKDRSFIVNRIWVEAPRLNPDGRTPLEQAMKQAYAIYLSGE
jgi:peptidoglycan/xylan/chitin deacetylase (PgdA/CDA1 family)